MSRGRITYKPPKPHKCRPPVFVFNREVGTLWECGSCGETWTVRYDAYNGKYWSRSK